MNNTPWTSLTRSAIIVFAVAAALAAACSSGEKSAEQAPGAPVESQPPPTVTPLPVLRGTPSGADAIGIYPTSLNFSDTLRGREYFGTVGLMNGGPAERTYRFEIAGTAAPWLALVSETDRTRVLSDISVPPASTARVLLRAVVPPSVANGDYGGSIQVVTRAGGGGTAEGSSVGVDVGAEINVSLAVTGTERIEGAFVEAATQDVESGYPLRIYSTISNSGNVQVNPAVTVDILDSSGNVVEHLASSDEVVYPNDRKQIVSQWETTGKAVGDRIGRVSVKFGAIDLGTKEVRFKIVPVGTFTRRGDLTQLQLANKPQPGDMAKFVATFTNTGQIETKGKFVGELYLGDRLIAALDGHEQLLMPGETAGLEVLAPVPEKGVYTVRGKVNYEGRETDVQEFTFRIGSEGGSALPTWLLIVVAAAAGSATLAGVGWIAWRKRAAAP